MKLLTLLTVQNYTPAQYFFMVLFAGVAILYLGGIYLIMNDKYEKRKEDKDGV